MRVPGDIARPLDWEALSTMDSTRWTNSQCGLEVVLKRQPSELLKKSDGRKRFIACSDAVILAGVRKMLLAYGVKDDAAKPK